MFKSPLIEFIKANRGNTFDPTETVVIVCQCPWCPTVNKVEIPVAGISVYVKGVSVQKAFPELNADTREILKTGVCVKCWDANLNGMGD